jgi:hypothetical protein
LSKNSRPPSIQNHLLAALPDIEYKRLLPHLESVSLPFMEVLKHEFMAIQTLE